jgi:hypothetical protein
MTDRTSGPGLDLDALRACIRQQAARRRAAAAEAPAQPTRIPAFNWLQVHCRLNAAERLTRAPGTVPHLWRFPGPIRYLARLAARLVLYVAQLITIRQGECNACLLQSLRDIAEGLRNAELSILRLDERIRRLETAVARLTGQAGWTADSRKAS